MIKVLAYNYVYSSYISSSSENSQFPTTNIKDDRRSVVFRSLDSSGWVTFDFGESVEINSFAMVDNVKKQFNLSNVVIKLNNSNAWGSPLYQASIDLDYMQGIGFKFFNPVNARYARIEFDSNEDFCELSKVYWGKWEDTLPDASYPLDWSIENLSKIESNRYGQKFIDEITQRKNLALAYEYLTKEEIEPVLDILTDLSNTKPLWVIIDCDEITLNNNRISGYYYQKELPDMSYGVGGFWNLKLDLHEGT